MSASRPLPRRPRVRGTVRRSLTTFTALALALATQQLAAGALVTTDASAPADTGGVPYLVTFAEGTSAADQQAVLSAAGVVETAAVAPLRLHVVDIPSGGEGSVVNSLRADTTVVRVEAEKTRSVEADPSDPSYAEQWSLPRIGWDQARAAGPVPGTAVVAVLDTGVQGDHPDLAGQLTPGQSVIDGTTPTSDPNGHGTAMAGIVAAATDNAVGIAGVGFDGVKVMPVTVLAADGTGQDSDVIAGLVYAADHGADVALMAFSSPSYSPSLQAAVDYAWSKGMVVVAAAGNDGASAATFPAGDRGVLGVSNTTETDQLEASSNSGPAVFLGAPGTNILTTSRDGGYAAVTGTSASAAEVAGSAARLLAADPSLPNAAVVGRLARNTDAVGTQDETGNGRLNLARALSDAATDPVKPSGAAPLGDSGPFVGPYLSADKGLTITFAGGGGGTIAFDNMVPARAVAACTATCSRQLDNNQTGRLTVTPNAGSTFTGWSGSFVSGGTTTCTTTTNPCAFSMSNAAQNLTATFTAPPANRAPVAANDTATVAEDASVAINVLGNDSDPDGTTPTVKASSITAPAHGTATVVTSGPDAGKILYTPAANFHGPDSFTYRGTDGSLDSNLATVSVTVTSVNDAPVAGDDTATVVEDASVAINVLGNDSDPDGTTPTVKASSITAPAHGTATV